MNDIKPEQTLNRRLVHGKICRALCLEAKDRIEALEATVRGLGNAHHDEVETRTKNTKLQPRIEALEAKLKKIETWRDKWGPTDVCKYAIQMEALDELEAILEKDERKSPIPWNGGSHT